MSFAWDGRRFPDVAAVEAYIASLSDAQLAWIGGVTVHHTWAPTLEQWHASGGKAEVAGLAHYYEFEVQNPDGSRGWPAGPHLFIVDNEIWLGTPFTTQGVHATICNSHYLGFEVVGDYDHHYWSPGTEHNVLGCVSAVLRRRKLQVNAATLRGHRDCSSPKTCPGTAVSMDVVRQKVRETLGSVPLPVPVEIGHHAVIGVPQSVTQKQWQAYLLKYGVNLLQPEYDFVYAMATRLQVDIAFVSAMWKQESFDDDLSTPEIKAVIGGGVLQRQTRNPINITEPADSTRDKVLYKGRYWRQWQSWQLGLIDAILYLKQFHGAHGRLTVEDIIPVHCPDKDNPDLPSKVYIANVLTRMVEMRTL